MKKSGFYWDTWSDSLFYIDGTRFWYYNDTYEWLYYYFHGIKDGQDRFEYIERL